MMRMLHPEVKEVRMQRDPLPGRQVVCNSLLEGVRFRQSRQSRPEGLGVSEGI